MLPLYKNIKMLRVSNGWDQELLAKKVGYADKSMISRIENGKVDLKQSQILVFASVFGVEPGMLFGGSAAIVSDFEHDLIIAYRQAPESRREAVRALLNVQKKGSLEQSMEPSVS
ncbi:MAG: helix-turn-helix transcriptional regulator [Aeriscardovia sp.]|nr:helix-turn-helix transcriptional regulator [Aeriscardovia sp.]